MSSIIDGKKIADIGFKPPSAGRSKKNTPYPNYFTVTDCFRLDNT